MTEEEKKKIERPDDYVAPTYAPPAPTATYAGSDSERMYNAIMQRYAEVADPQRQAEQDEKIARGRQFWTGANLFANVIANAINANGTANGAPNMTFNDAATEKMYGVWRDADKQLRADRKDAQQRYDAMALQDAQMRLADQQAADKAAQTAYDRNYAAQQETARINLNNQWADYRQQEARRQKLEDEERNNKEWERRNAIQYQQNERLARIRHSGSGRSSSSASNGGVSVSVGSIDIPAKDKNEAQRIRKNIANKIVDAKNKQIAEENKKRKLTEQIPLMEKPKNDKEAEAIIYQNDDIYDTDENFRNEINQVYGIEDIYNEEPIEFDQFGGYSVKPEDGYSMPVGRRYVGSTVQNPRAFVPNRTAQKTQRPHVLSEGEKEVIKKSGKKPLIEY